MSNYWRRTVSSREQKIGTPSDIATKLAAYDMPDVQNDGDHQYIDMRFMPKSNSDRYGKDAEIEVYLTDPSVDITEFDKSFIELTVSGNLLFDSGVITELRNKFNAVYLPSNTTESNKITSATDYEHNKALQQMLLDNQFIFIGYKSSNQVMSNYHFMINNVAFNETSHQHAVCEGFLSTVYKSRADMSNKKYVFSPYNEVVSFDNSVCGAWVPLSDLISGNCNFSFQVIIPYNEILALQAFDNFPNWLFGNLILSFKATNVSQVWTEVNPYDSITRNIVRGIIKASDYPELTSILACAKETWGYTRAFQQIGLINQVCFCTGNKWDSENNKWTEELDFYTGPICPRTDTGGFQVSKVQSFTKGYRLNTTVKGEMENYFLDTEFGGQGHVFVVPAQHITRFGMSDQPVGTTFNIESDIPISRATDLYVLMPWHTDQTTCFCNPSLQSFQIHIGSRSYPRQEVSTVGPEFYTQQLQQSDFDNFFEANDSFEHSLTDARCDKNGFRNPYTDDTSFVFAISLERSNAGPMIFDGLDGSQHIRLSGSALYNQYSLYTADNIDPNVYHTGRMASPAVCSLQNSIWIFRRIIGAGGAPMVNCQYVLKHDYGDAKRNRDVEGFQKDFGGNGNGY